MMSLGMSAAERAAFRAALHSRTQRLRLHVHCYDHNERRVDDFLIDGDIVGVVGGQVDIAAGDTPTRTAQLTVDDPDQTITFDPDVPGRHVWFNNFIRIDRGIYVDDPFQDYVDVPLIFGRLSQWQRQGSQVQISVVGKESVLTEPYVQWQPRSFAKGTNTVTAIKRALQAKGETRFDFPRLTHRLGRTWSLARYDDTWKECRQRAGMMDDGYQLFYDGWGRAKLRPFPTDPVLTVDETWLTDAPQHSVDIGRLRNVVDYQAGDILGRAKNAPTVWLQVQVYPDAGHPLSPQQLGRNGHGFFLPEKVDSGHGVRHSALSWARRRLNQLLDPSEQQSVNVLPILGLEELDYITVADRYGTFTIRMTEASIPLTLDGSMSIGRQTLYRLQHRHTVTRGKRKMLSGNFGQHHSKGKATS